MRRLWERVGKGCEWEHPRAPAARLLWDIKATDAVVGLLESTRVRCRTAARVIGPREKEGQASRGKKRKGGRTSLRLHFPLSPFFSFAFVLLFPLFFPLSGGQGSRRSGCPRLTRSGLGENLVM